MENTMASSNVDDKLKKDTENKETGNKETNKILTFIKQNVRYITCLLYTSPSPRDCS